MSKAYHKHLADKGSAYAPQMLTLTTTRANAKNWPTNEMMNMNVKWAFNEHQTRAYLYSGQDGHDGGYSTENHVEADEELVEQTALWLSVEQVHQDNGDKWHDVVESSYSEQGWTEEDRENQILVALFL